MKYDLFAFIFTAVVTIAINFLLYRWWKREGILKNSGGHLIGLILFGLIPTLFVFGFLLFWFLIPTTDSAHIYNYFSLFVMWYLFLFIPELAIVLIILTDRLLRMPFKKATEKGRHYPRLSRRKFLSQIGIILATAPFVTLLFGAFKGRYAFYTKHVRISFPNLPIGFDGLRIVQISDLHLGSFGSNKESLTEAFKLVNAEHPDLILFTGDLVNNFAGEIKGWEEVFAQLKAPMGKYSILGNHDYGNYSRWSSAQEKIDNFNGVVQGHQNLGFTLLKNQSVKLERRGDTIGLGGVENWGRASYPRKGDLNKASEHIKETPFRILMSHDPDHWDTKILAHDFYDLTLSGHTHGMQFGFERGDIRWSPAKYIQKRWAGLFREGDKFLYVNRGLGYLGMPARVGMPPEITVIELTRAGIGSEAI